MARSDSARHPIATRDAFDALVAALRSRLHQGSEIPIDACERFVQRLGQLSGRRLASEPPPAAGPSLPILAQMPGALAAARDAVPDLADPLEALLPGLSWTQNPNYRRHPPAVDFLDRYGYAQLAGPANVPTLATSEELALGVLMLAPGTVYPAHAHPAEEIYVPLAPARWQRGEEGWRDRRAGDLIHHPSGLVHATQAGEAPLLAFYLWLGDLGTAARIVGA